MESKQGILTQQLEELEDQLKEVTAKLIKQTCMLQKLDDEKLAQKKYEEFLGGLDKKLEVIDNFIVEHQNKLVALENYTEKYIPMKTQNIILSNLKLVVTED